jgi:GAF domain-containing protein
MTAPASHIPANDNERIEVLRKYEILDTPEDGTFDHLTKLAATIFKVPVAIVSLVDTDRIWFKSHYGLSINQIDRDPGLCASAILSHDTYVVENAATDPRTLSNPLVAGDFGLRFYAAAPLETEDHYNLGTFCLLDKHPRTFTAEEKEILTLLARVVMDAMELRLKLRSTMYTVKNLLSDVSGHLEDAAINLRSASNEDQSALISYIDDSQMYLQNLKNQIDF